MSVAIHYAGNLEAAEQAKAACQAVAVSTAQEFHLIQADIGTLPPQSWLNFVLTTIARYATILINAQQAGGMNVVC